MTHRLEQLLAACWLSFVGLLVAAKLAARAVRPSPICDECGGEIL